MELSARGLFVRWAKTTALSGIDLLLHSTERVLVLGSAGAGKTTLLKCLAGLVRPSGGDLLWGGAPVWQMTESQRRQRQRSVGVIFQTDALFDSMSVLANAMLPLVQRKVADAEATRQARLALAQVGLLDSEGLLPEALSGGMRKRVGIARALVASPEVLLADDPLAGLDPATASQIGATLGQAAAGRSLIWAASEPPASVAFDRWVILEGGRVVHDGPALSNWGNEAAR